MMNITIKLIPAKIAISGAVRLTQALYDTPAIERPARSEAIVGAIIFKSPEAVANATTATSRLAPESSETGAIIGIVAVAKPELEGMINDIGI